MTLVRNYIPGPDSRLLFTIFRNHICIQDFFTQNTKSEHFINKDQQVGVY